MTAAQVAGAHAGGFSLLELVVTIMLIGVLAIPLGRLLGAQLQTSVQADLTLAAANFARYEQERAAVLGFAAVTNWCNVPRSQVPSETYCPASVALPNPYPYPGTPYYVTREVAPQSPTDNSSSAEMKRITVRVFRPGQATPLVAVTTYRANAVSFGT